VPAKQWDATKNSCLAEAQERRSSEGNAKVSWRYYPRREKPKGAAWIRRCKPNEPGLIPGETQKLRLVWPCAGESRHIMGQLNNKWVNC
jgi:hypothetical protein